MFNWLKGKLPDEPNAPDSGIRPVPGAGIYRDRDGQVIYNLLDPIMQQFLGRCIGAIKKAGIRTTGTGSFSILLGEDQKVELQLDQFWKEFCDSQDPEVFGRVAEAAKQAVGGG
ncbi:MAG: hypothetical protein MUF06_23125 [Pirellulaceae bacterium]|nr:hypothetical protein [Pirellulaceae bacterium]